MSFQVTEEVITKAKARLKKLTAGWAVGICCGNATDLNDKLIENTYPHGNCHSWVSQAFTNYCGGHTPKYFKKGSNFLSLTCHSKKRSKASAKATDGIILFLARESKFSPYILNRDDEKSLTRDGAVILCGPDGVTQAEAMWICKVLRYSTEGSRALDTWLALKEGGVDPMLALRICNDIQPLEGATFGHSPVVQHLSVFGNDWDCKVEPDLKALADGESDKEATTTGSLFSKKGAPPSGTYSNTFKKFCKPFKKSDGWGGEIEGEGVSKEDLIYHALAWQKEVLGQGEPVLVKEAVLPTREIVFLGYK